MSGRVEIDEDRCKGCGLCVAHCPSGVLQMSSGRETNGNGYYHPVVKSDCSGCGNCYEVCSDYCISVMR